MTEDKMSPETTAKLDELTKRAEAAEARLAKLDGEQRIVEQHQIEAAIAKQADTTCAAALAKYNAYLDTQQPLFKSRSREHVAGLLLETGDATMKSLAADLRKAQEATIMAPVEYATKSITPRVEALQKQFDGERETFARAHNMTADEAHERLMSIAPSYKALHKQWTQAHDERAVAADAATKRANVARYQQFADEQELAKQADQERARKADAELAKRRAQNHGLA